MTTHEEMMAKLSKARRERIEARAAERRRKIEAAKDEFGAWLVAQGPRLPEDFDLEF